MSHDNANCTRISKIENYEGKEVTLKGWLYNKRGSGKIQFLQIRDGSGIIQCVLSKKTSMKL